MGCHLADGNNAKMLQTQKEADDPFDSYLPPEDIPLYRTTTTPCKEHISTSQGSIPYTTDFGPLTIDSIPATSNSVSLLDLQNKNSIFISPHSTPHKADSVPLTQLSTPLSPDPSPLGLDPSFTYTPHTYTVPDGGYGWVVLGCAFMLQIISTGVTFSSGVFIVEFRESLRISPEQASWAPAIKCAVAFGGSPVGGILCNRFSHRTTIMAGCIIYAFGMILSAWATTLPHIYLTFGLIAGGGIALVYSPSVSVAGTYFHRRRAMVLGLVVIGAALGPLIFSPFFYWLITIYTWKGAFIIIAAMGLQGCVFAALLCPVQNLQKHGLELLKMNSSWKQITNISVFKLPSFYIQFINNLLWCIGISPIWALLPDYAKEVGMSKEQGALLISFVSLGNVIGRAGVALFMNYCKSFKNRLHVHNMSVIFGGAVIALYPVKEDFPMFTAISLCVGFTFGILVGSLPVVTAELYGPHQLTTAYSYIMIADGLGFMLGPPFTGFLFRISSGGYEVPFYTNSVIYCISGFVMYLVLLIYNPRDQSCDLQYQVQNRVKVNGPMDQCHDAH